MSPHFNGEVVAAAERTIRDLIDAALSLKGNGAVIGEAPAGAGKSYAVASAAFEALKRGLRVAVATPTNEQAASLIDELCARCPDDLKISAVLAGAVALPDHLSRHPAVQTKSAKEANAERLLVATLSKLGDAHGHGDLGRVDLLIIDEAFQANAVHYYGVGGLAARHLLMGDRGQLAPFTTAPNGDRWRGLNEDPLLTAVEVVTRNHADKTQTFKLPITRRLDTRGAAVARAFYPGHAFSSALNPDARALTFSAPADPAEPLDALLDYAAVSGWLHLEQPGPALTLADRGTVALLVALAARLLARRPATTCERHAAPKPLPQEELAVVVSHNDQKALLRAALDAVGLGGVVVNTANKLQGLTYEVVIAWHPLAGLTEVDEFHLDPGRLCVMLTRHRHLCLLVGRAEDRRLVEGLPPSAPTYATWSGAPALDGWYAHEAVLSALAPHRRPAPALTPPPPATP